MAVKDIRKIHYLTCPECMAEFGPYTDPVITRDQDNYTCICAAMLIPLIKI